MTACEVVAQKGQWSWYGKKPMKEMTGKMREWLSRVESSSKVLGNRVEYFHNGSVRPKWAKGMELVAEVGGHKFYRERT